MSAIIETLIICDGNPQRPGCEGTYANGDTRTRTASHQRNHYRADGWHFSRGKDYCPECWPLRLAPAEEA